MTRRPTYSKVFKLEAVRMLETSGKAGTEITKLKKVSERVKKELNILKMTPRILPMMSGEAPVYRRAKGALQNKVDVSCATKPIYKLKRVIYQALPLEGSQWQPREV